MRRPVALLVIPALLLAALAGGTARAQCILANPSFERDGSGGETFGGWYEFGDVGSISDAVHGSKAARVTGPDLGGWDVSGFWQRQDSVPGEQWEVSVWVGHSATAPLTGESTAIVNIEWRDSGDGLISYESHTAASASTPPGEYSQFSVASGPAPAGTETARILLGVLQSPADPPPDVFYDQVTFYSMSSPTMDEQQWDDFPGGRTVDFAGRTWRVKGPGYYGPGPNDFCDSEDCVWVDVEGRLHLTVQRISGTWYSTEVALEDALGYGDYIFTTYGRVDLLDPAVVFGLFLWQYGPCYDTSYLWWNPFNEIDIEFSRWGSPANDLGQFVAQPYDYPGNISRFDATFTEHELASHAFLWLPDRVEFRSWRGGPADEAPENLIAAWTYTGPHIPRPEQPRVHLNLWQFSGPPDSYQEVVLDDLTFFPAAPSTDVPDPGELAPSESAVALLHAARPNPFGPRTEIGYFLKADMFAEVAVYDVAGRRVRTLVSGPAAAGEHETSWDGRDELGKQVASGVYLYSLRAGDVVETRRMVLVR